MLIFFTVLTFVIYIILRPRTSEQFLAFPLVHPCHSLMSCGLDCGLSGWGSTPGSSRESALGHRIQTNPACCTMDTEISVLMCKRLVREFGHILQSSTQPNIALCLYFQYPLSYRVPVRERYGSTLLPATREQHDQNCTQSH